MNLYGKFVKNISFPLLAKKAVLNNLYPYIKALEESQFWDLEKLSEYQTVRLKELLIHAFKNTKFYKKRFSEDGFNPYDFKAPEDLSKISLLTKDQIRDHLPEILAANFDANELHKSETGGTTGVKMYFYRDNNCLSPKEAARYRFEKWAGWDIGEKMGIVWPAQQDYVGHWTLKAKIKNEMFERQVVFPATVMDDASISRYVKKLLQRKPSIIRAFTSPLHEVAKYILEKDLSPIRLKGAITTGEPLYPHQRKIISEAFCCPVYDSYRTREAGVVAQECEVHNGLHINAESLYLETVPYKNGGAMHKDLDEILVTDLWNYGMPLIRYKIGDLGIISKEKCSCGRGLPLLKKIAGRTPDIFYTTDGKPIVAITLVLYLVDEAPGLLGQVQIIQERLDHLIIKMTPDPMPTEKIKSYQIQKVKELMGHDMKVSFEIVDHIPRESSGKYLFTKCLIDKTKAT